MPKEITAVQCEACRKLLPANGPHIHVDVITFARKSNANHKPIYTDSKDIALCDADCFKELIDLLTNR